MRLLRLLFLSCLFVLFFGAGSSGEFAIVLSGPTAAWVGSILGLAWFSQSFLRFFFFFFGCNIFELFFPL